MKQYKITSKDILGSVEDQTMPDAYIDPNDPVVKQFNQQIVNPIANHFKTVLTKDDDAKAT